MGSCQTDPPLIINKIAFGYAGKPLDSWGLGHRMRSHSCHLMTFSGVLGFDMNTFHSNLYQLYLQTLY